jgi:hypothetical protein
MAGMGGGNGAPNGLQGKGMNGGAPTGLGMNGGAPMGLGMNGKGAQGKDMNGAQGKGKGEGEWVSIPCGTRGEAMELVARHRHVQVEDRCDSPDSGCFLVRVWCAIGEARADHPRRTRSRTPRHDIGRARAEGAEGAEGSEVIADDPDN